MCAEDRGGAPRQPEPAEATSAEARLPEPDEYVHGRFGARYENVTGFTTAPVTDDSAAKVWLLSSVFRFVVVTTFGIHLATTLISPEWLRASAVALAACEMRAAR